MSITEKHRNWLNDLDICLDDAYCRLFDAQIQVRSFADGEHVERAVYNDGGKIVNASRLKLKADIAGRQDISDAIEFINKFKAENNGGEKIQK